ncbi:phosphotransferase [candidate division KSB1 bacterium]|nr:phosphotransferase [candidate division KSB1 bacterium]
MKRLEDLYQNHYGLKPIRIIPLRSDGSDRQIYRIYEQSNDTKIGIIGNNREENEAFINFTQHFKKYRLKVPEIYTQNLDKGVYIEEDLGDDTLFDWMMKIRDQHGFTGEIKSMYEKVVKELPEFQITAGRSIDYSFAYQHIEFSRESMSWDLHYFKSRFLNYFYKSKIDHTRLESDFNMLIDYLLQEDRDFFLYRDFQSRNIMIKNDVPYFIDYQSGRKGALQYDLASLLYDAKADLNQAFREEMIDVYLLKTRNLIDLDVDRFKEYFFGFVLIRIMQAFGAYGYLSAIKGKTHFFKSVPYAIANLEIICDKHLPILEKCTNLKTIFMNLTQDQSLREFTIDE